MTKQMNDQTNGQMDEMMFHDVLLLYVIYIHLHTPSLSPSYFDQ